MSKERDTPHDESPKMEAARNAAAYHLDEIRKLFNGDPKITLLVRQPENDEADFTLSDDEHHEIAKLIRRRFAVSHERNADREWSEMTQAHPGRYEKHDEIIEECAKVCESYGLEGDGLAKEYAHEMAAEVAARLRKIQFNRAAPDAVCHLGGEIAPAAQVAAPARTFEEWFIGQCNINPKWQMLSDHARENMRFAWACAWDECERRRT